MYTHTHVCMYGFSKYALDNIFLYLPRMCMCLSATVTLQHSPWKTWTVTTLSLEQLWVAMALASLLGGEL